jgi:hypothetical protein
MDRFWSKVNIGSENDCWNWNAGTVGGYGSFSYKGKTRTSNRMAWIFTNGEIKGNLHVLHTCNNKMCCNPNHLYLGTMSDNMRDAVRDGVSGVFALMGEFGGNIVTSKLSPEDVREIKQLLKNGETCASIGWKYNVSSSNISAIKTGRTWKKAI